MGKRLERIRLMWNVEPLLRCPYCLSELQLLKCGSCGRQYEKKNEMFYMYDESQNHWQACMQQIKALFRLDYQDDWKPRRDDFDNPYKNVDQGDIHQRAKAALFNVSKDLIGERMFSDGLALDIGAYNGWASFQFARWKKTVALDTSEHPCYGLGGVPRDFGLGIEKIIADGCRTPFGDNVFEIVFMASSLHHMHNKLTALNEAHRILKQGGIFIAFGDLGVREDQIEGFMSDGIRDYEGLPYTQEQMLEWLSESEFEEITPFPIRYSDHMHRLGFFSLVREPPENLIIYGVKT